MKNKKARDFVLTQLEGNQRKDRNIICFYWDVSKLSVEFYNGWGPDNYDIDCAPFKQGTVSLTANQLRGK